MMMGPIMLSKLCTVHCINVHGNLSRNCTPILGMSCSGQEAPPPPSHAGQDCTLQLTQCTASMYTSRARAPSETRLDLFVIANHNQAPVCEEGWLNDKHGRHDLFCGIP